MKPYDFLLIGAGIFGLTAAIALRQRNYRVGILNPDVIPHPLAASTDISKVVRMEYGADREYMEMVDVAIDGWHSWNDLFQDRLYHEIGFLMLRKTGTSLHPNSFEETSFQNLLIRGHQPERLEQNALQQRFPAFAPAAYSDAIFNPRAGFAESGRVVETLLAYAQQLGVVVHQTQTASHFELANSRVEAVHTLEGERFRAGHVIVCAGAYTQYLLPELKPVMRATGHPVFHVQPSRPELFLPPKFSVFTSDISNTGWYGFPLHPSAGVVKIGNHGVGQDLDPVRDERLVDAQAVAAFRQFLIDHIPALAQDPIVFTRRCLYSDTLDGHFWIDHHPELKGLSVAAGGSGHGFKMAPVLGAMIADVAEGGAHIWSARFRWRQFDASTIQEEEARYKAT